MPLYRLLFVLFFITGDALAHGSLHGQIQDLSATMRREGKSAPLLVKRGRLQMEHGNHQAATRDLLEALRRDPGERSAYYYLAEQACNQRQFPEARRYAEKFLSMLHGEPGAMVRGNSLFGQILLAQAQYKEAAAAFRIAADQAAEPSPEHYLHLADAQSKADAAAQALASLDEGMQKLGMLTVLQNKAISLQVASKAWDDALTRLDAMVAQGQGLPELYLRKANILLAAGRQSTAREAAQAGLAAIDQIPAARRETPAMNQLRADLIGQLGN